MYSYEGYHSWKHGPYPKGATSGETDAGVIGHVKITIRHKPSRSQVNYSVGNGGAGAHTGNESKIAELPTE